MPSLKYANTPAVVDHWVWKRSTIRILLKVVYELAVENDLLYWVIHCVAVPIYVYCRPQEVSHATAWFRSGSGINEGLKKISILAVRAGLRHPTRSHQLQASNRVISCNHVSGGVSAVNVTGSLDTRGWLRLLVQLFSVCWITPCASVSLSLFVATERVESNSYRTLAWSHVRLITNEKHGPPLSNNIFIWCGKRLTLRAATVITGYHNCVSFIFWKNKWPGLRVTSFNKFHP